LYRFTVLLDRRARGNETRGWVVEPHLGEIGEHKITGFLGFEVSWRRENASMNYIRLHPGQNFWLPAHLDAFYVTIRLKAPLLYQKAQSEICRGGVACKPQSLATQVLLSLDRWLTKKVESRHVSHTAEGYNIRAGKIGKDNIAARQGYCEFTSDHRLGHSAASRDIDLIDDKSMFVKDVCILGKIESGLGCADGAVGDGDAFGLTRRGCGNS